MKYLLTLLFLLLPTSLHAERYTVRYSRSDSTGPSYRTFRLFRGRTQVGYLAPRPAPETMVKHKEKHRHGRHKVRHTEVTR